MKVFVPQYFDEFTCIADKCPDTCCIGWEVDIDNETAGKYSHLDGCLGEKIKNKMVKDEDGSHLFTLSENDRCPFLNECNLCEIHIGAGESFLSKTCTLFPRFFDDFGSFREMGLGFGCPEAARIILEDEELFSLRLYEETSEISEEVDEDFLEKLISLRKELFDILEKENFDFKTKIKIISDKVKTFQKNIEGEKFFEISQDSNFYDCICLMERMEYIKPERKEFIKKLKGKSFSENIFKTYQGDFEKLMKYYIFRYLLKAVYDYDVLTKVKYGIFACIVIARIYSLCENPDFDTRAKIMYSFSKEVEYSDVNTELLDEAMFYDFSTEDLINLI